MNMKWALWQISLVLDKLSNEVVQSSDTTTTTTTTTTNNNNNITSNGNGIYGRVVPKTQLKSGNVYKIRNIISSS